MLQELTQVLKDKMGEVVRNVHTCMPGTILAFDPSKCEATVKPLGVFKKPDGATIPFPEIPKVPVMFPQSNGLAIAHPVKSGDGCLVLFSEQSLELWRTGAEPDVSFEFDLTNAIAIPGLLAQPNPLIKKAADENAVIISNKNSTVSVNESNVNINNGVAVIAGSGITMNGNVTVNGTLVVNN